LVFAGSKWRSIREGRPIRLERIDFATAQQFFQKYEHLGNCGLGVWHWGAFCGTQLIATVSFGTTCFGKRRGALQHITAEFGLETYQIARGGTVSNAPLNTPSRVLSSALNEFHRFRGDCLVIAYADRAYNEVGTIYQACNGLYTGNTQPKNQSNYFMCGREMSGWSVRKKFGTRSMESLRRIDINVVKMPLSSKYRYVFVQASRATRNRILEALRPLVKPYPSRSAENIPSMNIQQLVIDRATFKELAGGT
jgi:hypothetical protein